MPAAILDDDWSSCGSARFRDGSSRPFVIRFLRTAELDALWVLHRLVCDRLPHPHLFRHDSLDYMAKNIDDAGRTVGVFIDGALVAYGAVSFCRDGENPGLDVGLSAEALALVAAYDGSAVHPDLRGGRLQQLMTEVRHACARARGKRHILGTVWPGNHVSLANFLAVGNRVRALRLKYGGMLRLIIHADLCGWPPAGDTAVEVGLDDVPELTRLLHAGYEGLEVVLIDGRPALRMHRIASAGIDPAAAAARELAQASAAVAAEVLAAPPAARAVRA